MLHGQQSNVVFLNVYDIIPHNAVLSEVGLGVHHSGVEVYGKEISFGRCAFGTGVFTCTPCHCPKHSFREQHLIGRTTLSSEEVDALIRQLSELKEWSGQNYHLLRRNCNHFAEEFASILLPPARRLVDDEEWGKMVFQGAGYMTEARTSRRVRRLMPLWVNQLARFGLLMLSERYVERLENLDRAAQGVPPLAPEASFEV